MTKTKIQKALAIVALASLAFTNVSAATIGTATVTGSGAFDTNIIWDDVFPGSASGSVSNIKVKARIDPVLSMVISDFEIDLGTLTADVPSTGNLTIEVGTNAVSGVSITARSQDSGLTSLSDPTVQINSLATDGIVESYLWSSAVGTDDSSFAAFAATGLSSLEIDDNVTEHVVYSTNKPEATLGSNDVTFTVSAESTSETPAGDYEDNITFTVTGNF